MAANVKEGTRRLALVAGFVGLSFALCAALVAPEWGFLDIHERMRLHNEFESLVTSDQVKDCARRLTAAPDNPLASELRFTFPGAYEDMSDAELAQGFSALVRQADSKNPPPVTDVNELKVLRPLIASYADDLQKGRNPPRYGAFPVRGPDNKLYVFPLKPSQALATAYFVKQRGARLSHPIPGSTTAIDAGKIKSITWGENGGINWIQTQDGRELSWSETRAPSYWRYLAAYSSFLFAGFLLPWGAVRTLGWIILGFQKG